MTLTEIRGALQVINLRPSRRLGQNYLHDQNLARIIVETARIAPETEVVEIGPGLGSLTEFLVPAAARLEVIEKDGRAAAWLRAKFPGLAVVEGDATEENFIGRRAPDWICIGNLPYSAASRIIVRLCQERPKPIRMVFTVQREVADRLTARHGVKDYGLLTLLTRPFYEIRTVRRLPASVFFPEPEVESSVVLFERRDCALPAEAETRYRQTVKQAFQQRRKTLGAIFGRNPPPGLDARKRPAEIPIQQWVDSANLGV